MMYTIYLGGERRLTDTFRVSMEDSDAPYGVLHICEQLDNTIGYIKPTAYQCDLLYVRTSLDNSSCPTMHSEDADARKADPRESAFNSSRVFTAETVYNLESMEVFEGT